MITAILTWFTGSAASIIPWILGIVGAGAGLLFVRQTGKDAVIADQTKQQLEKTNAALQITQNVSTLSDADVDKQLREQFSTK